MSVKSISQFNFVDIIFYSFGALILSTALLLFTQRTQLMRRLAGVHRNTAESVATVTNLVGDVDLRPQAELAWVPIEKGDAIFSGDTIVTSPKGGLDLVFTNNERLSIPHSSRVQIFFSNSHYELLVQSGEIVTPLPKVQPKLDSLTEDEIKEAKKPEIDVPDQTKSSGKSTEKLEVYPPVDSYVLISSSFDINVAVNKKCINNCHLKVVFEKKTVCDLTPKPGQMLECTFTANDALQTVLTAVDVDYDNGEDNQKYQFQLGRMSPESMKTIQDPKAKVLIQ